MSKHNNQKAALAKSFLKDQKLGLCHDNAVMKEHPLALTYSSALTNLDALASQKQNHGRPGQFSADIEVMDLDRCEHERCTQLGCSPQKTADAVAGLPNRRLLIIELKLGVMRGKCITQDSLLDKFNYSRKLLGCDGKYLGGIYPKFLLVLPSIDGHSVMMSNIIRALAGSNELKNKCAVTTPEGFSDNLS